MSRATKTLEKVLLGNSDANLAFDDLCRLLQHLGFSERIRGSHHIFSMEGVEEILNLQAKKGKAKPYQVRQVRELILAYDLASESTDSEESESEETNGDAPAV